MKFTTFILLFVAAFSWADADVLKLKSKDQEFTFQKKENVWVSESCLTKDCEAFKKVEIKEKSKDGLVGQPAADACEESGGKYTIAKHKNGDEDGVCVFKDKSYILGWDFYKRNKK